jgi:hypothetical protein
VYLSCSTNAPKASCAITSGDALDTYTVDFSKTLTPTATVTITTTANAAQAGLIGPSRMGVFGLAIAAIVMIFLLPQTARLPLARVGGCLVLAAVMVPSCGGGSNGGGGGGGGGGTTPGNYTITVSAYSVSNTGAAADATTNIALTVN